MVSGGVRRGLACSGPRRQAFVAVAGPGAEVVHDRALKVRGSCWGPSPLPSAESARQYMAADLGLAEDLANRAAVSIENARLYAEVKEGDRRKDEFLAMLAHELRNPLAPICNALDLLGMSECDPKMASGRGTS